PPVDGPRESRHQVCPISRLLFEQAAGGGIAFPTGSADARQVSTRRENRLRVRSCSSIEHHIFTRCSRALHWKCKSSGSGKALIHARHFVSSRNAGARRIS